jgi:hypothetical protein
MHSDEDHLRLLSIFHFVFAGLAGLFSLLPILHLLIGLGIITGTFPPGAGKDGLPAAFGWFFVALASFFILCGLTFAICLLVAGRYLIQHRGYLFCLIVAAFACLAPPFGTVLGVFTIIVLMRPSVKELFGQGVATVPA